MRNFWTAGEGKEIVEIVTLPDCKDDVEDHDCITDSPPVPFHSEAYSLINKLMMVGSTKWLQCRFSAASPYTTAECGDETMYKTDTVPRNKLLLLTNAVTQWYIHVHCIVLCWLDTHVVIARLTSWRINHEYITNKLDYSSPRLSEHFLYSQLVQIMEVGVHNLCKKVSN